MPARRQMRRDAPATAAADRNRGLARGAVAMGALAAGAIGIGALAIGYLAVRRLRVHSGHFDELSIGTLRIERLVITQEEQP